MTRRDFALRLGAAALAAHAHPTAAQTPDAALAELLARLTPEGRAKLPVAPEQLTPEGHELAQTFLRPLAEGNGPLTAADIEYETVGERLGRTKWLADRVLEHKVSLLGGYEQQDLGTPIDWFRAPKGDWQWPTHLSRHYWLLPAAYAWRATGDQRYADTAIAILLDWVARTPNGSEDLQNSTGGFRPDDAPAAAATTQQGVFKGYVDGPWTSLSAHTRVDKWSELLQLLWDAPSMSNAAAAVLLNSLVGVHRVNMLEYPRAMNQYQGVASSLINLGFFYPDFVGIAEAEAVGWKRLAHHTSTEIYPDGSMAECSPNYGMGMVTRLNDRIAEGRRRGRDIPALLPERVALAARYFALTADPLGRSPRIAKGGGNVRGSLAALNEGVDDPVVAFVASGGERGTAPERACQTFPWAGHHAFRSGWDADATWLFFEPGPRGTGHHDRAQLGVQLLAAGEWLLADPGYYTYSGAGREGAISRYLASTAAHNTGLVDGEGQVTRPKGSPSRANTEPGDYGWTDDGETVSAEGTYTYGYGPDGAIAITHHRRVVYRPDQDVFEIEDRFEGDGEHAVALHWQTHPDMAVAVEGERVVVNGQRARLTLAPESDATLTITTHRAEEEPFLGWYSEGYGKLAPAITVRVATAKQALPVVVKTRVSVGRG